MAKLSPQSSEKVCKAIEKMGFVNSGKKGSHIFYKHIDGRTTVVPFHKGEEISKGLRSFQGRIFQIPVILLISLFSILPAHLSGSLCCTQNHTHSNRA